MITRGAPPTNNSCFPAFLIQQPVAATASRTIQRVAPPSAPPRLRVKIFEDEDENERELSNHKSTITNLKSIPTSLMPAHSST